MDEFNEVCYKAHTTSSIRLIAPIHVELARIYSVLFD